MTSIVHIWARLRNTPRFAAGSLERYLFFGWKHIGGDRTFDPGRNLFQLQQIALNGILQAEIQRIADQCMPD